MGKLIYEKESFEIRKCIFDIYKKYRNYHKENVYHNALLKEFEDSGFDTIKNKRISIYHKGKKVGTYVPDIVIDNKILLELKCKPRLLMADRKQFWHYLKSTDYKLGFLVNFGHSSGVEIERKVFDEARNKIDSV
ncbi:GxxExxY protein [bacterium]|nr:GxxExxY protein [bacterium]